MGNGKSIDHFISQIEEIYTIPAIALKVIQLLTDPEVRISDLANVIKADQALAIDILKVANSGYFNFKEEICTIQKAIVLMGLNLTKEISISLAIKSLIKDMVEVKDINFHQFWLHVTYSGIFSKKIAQFIHLNCQFLFIFGLLHDLGVILEILYNPDLFAKTFKKALDTRTPYYLLEKDVDEFDHARLGGSLLEIWKIPQQIWVPIKYHHNPRDVSPEEINYIKEIHCLYLGNICSHLYIKDVDGYDQLITEELLKEIGLDGLSFEKLRNKISMEMEEEKELISLLT